jgi:predicted Zn-dependent protease
MRQGYTQAQEFEADMEAIVLLAGAGYDPQALLEMLRILQRVQSSDFSSGSNRGFYSTHPIPVMRIANIERLNFRNSNTGSYRLPRFRNFRIE